ncbi:MAG: hypothetical protein HY727_07210 [Candidatus Rokubacteria bacterium]|nr:hypothetical protein [Candidatus Rokubacteria bacterium]
MGKGKGRKARAEASGALNGEQAQPPLIPLSDAELRQAGKTLADLIRQLRDLKANHKASREAQREARDALAAEIEAVASTIRTQGR